MPGHDALSSTPATNRTAGAMDSYASNDDPSWVNSMQSPLQRLKSEIQNFSTNDDSILSPDPGSTSTSSTLDQTPTVERSDSRILPPSTAKSKGKQPELIRKVLKHNLYNQTTDEFTIKNNVSPLKVKKTPAKDYQSYRSHNPYLSPGADSSEWTGVVDLRDPKALTPKRSGHSSKSKDKTPIPLDDYDDDSFDDLPKGMSPPVLLSPARPPRSSAELGLYKIGTTPSRLAASRIVRDVVRDVHASGYKSRSYYNNTDILGESSMSTVASPPSLSKYNQEDTSSSVADSTLDSMMRRVGLDVPTYSKLNATPGRSGRARRQPSTHLLDNSDDSFPVISQDQLFPQSYNQYSSHDLSSDSDSLDDMDNEVNNTANPSTAFLMASQGHTGADDSFNSSDASGDSLDEDVEGLGEGGIAPIHPFGGSMEDDGMDDEDDSFDYQPSTTEEETVFGMPPAQRMRADAQRAQAQALRMMGSDLLDDTIGMPVGTGVAETPTPGAAWQSGAALGGR